MWTGILLITGFGVALGVAFGVVLLFGLLYCYRRYVMTICSGLAAEHWTRNLQGTGSTLTWSTASNLEQVANLLCVQANSVSYPEWDGK